MFIAMELFVFTLKVAPGSYREAVKGFHVASASRLLRATFENDPIVALKLKPTSTFEVT